jgi:uncharacterized protein
MQLGSWCGDTVFSREPEQRSFGIVLKVSERCNLTCSYCYFFYGGDDSYKTRPPVIRGNIVDGLVAFLKDAIVRYRLTRIQLGLHGGEPLLLKKPIFEAFCASLRREIDPLCELDVVVQTNGVLIDEEWIRIFSRHRVDVGVSFDGDQAAHDVYRLDKKGRGTYAQTRRGWELLLRAFKAGLIRHPGVLCVVSPDRSGEEMYDHLARELRANSINFLLPDLTYSDDVSEEFVAKCGRYMRQVFRAWSAHTPRAVAVRFISEVYLPLLNDGYAEQFAARAHDPMHLLVVRSDGEITPVDKLSTVALRFNSTNLNVTSATLDQVLDGPLWAEFAAAQDRIPSACQSCKWRNICRGGPMETRYSPERGFDNPSIYCSALMDFYEYVAAALVRSGASAEQMSRRLRGEPSTAVSPDAPADFDLVESQA